MLMRESRQCNLNSVDIYCQGVLIHRHPLLHGLTQHQRAVGSGERHAPFTVLLADSPLRLLLWSEAHNPQPIGHNVKTQRYSLVECHIYRLCPPSTETPSDCISAVIIPCQPRTTFHISSIRERNISQVCFVVRSISGQTATIIGLSIGAISRG